MAGLTDFVRGRFPEYAAMAAAALAIAKYGPSAWKVIRKMYELFRALEAIAALPAEVAQIKSQVSEVRSEVKRNGGLSLKDIVERMAASNSARWALTGPVPSWESDASGSCVKANSAMCALTGFPEESTVGFGWKNFIHKDDLETVAHRWAEAVVDGADYLQEARYRSASGEVFWVRMTAQCMRVNGKVIGWIGKIEKLEGAPK